MVAFNFDCRTVDPAGAGSTVYPDGIYSVVITASGMVPTKKKDGEMLVLDHTIIEGEHKGGVITNRLNVKNPSAQASEIALRAVSALGHVTGVLYISDTAMLHNIPHKIRIETNLNEEGKPIGNNVIGYLDMNGQPAQKQGGVAPAQGSHSAAGAPAMQQQPPPAAQPPAWQAAPPQQGPTQQQPAPAWSAGPPPAAQPPQWGGQPTQPQQPQQPPQTAPAAAPWQQQPPPVNQPPPAAWGAPPSR